MIKIEIKDSVKIIENRNKIDYFVSGIEIFNFYLIVQDIFCWNKLENKEQRNESGWSGR